MSADIGPQRVQLQRLGDVKRLQLFLREPCLDTARLPGLLIRLTVLKWSMSTQRPFRPPLIRFWSLFGEGKLFQFWSATTDFFPFRVCCLFFAHGWGWGEPSTKRKPEQQVSISYYLHKLCLLFSSGCHSRERLIPNQTAHVTPDERFLSPISILSINFICLSCLQSASTSEMSQQTLLGLARRPKHSWATVAAGQLHLSDQRWPTNQPICRPAVFANRK